MALLSDQEIDERLQSADGWQREGDAITKTFERGDFVGSVKFVDQLVEPAHDRRRADDLSPRRVQLGDRPHRAATGAGAYRLVGDPPRLSACENRVALPVRLVRRARDARP